jgi:hypothetical protein
MKKIFIAAMLVAGVLTACNSQKQPQTEENMTTKLTLTQE